MMQNKSKSKKYHRLLRKEKKKKQKIEQEKLEEEDPEAALEKLEEMDKLRIQERMNQRHRSSKWAKFTGMRAVKDKDAAAALAENIRLHKELKAKTQKEDDMEEDT